MDDYRRETPPGWIISLILKCWKDIGANLLHRADHLSDTCGPYIGSISADLRIDVIVFGGCRL